MISQANRRPGHATCLSAIRSKPFAPVFTFQIKPLRFNKLLAAIHYIISSTPPNYNKKFIFACFCPQNGVK